MHRIDHATRAQNLLGTGRDGFTGGDPVTQVPATIVTADFLNALQEELSRAIELGGIALNKSSNEQLAALLATYGRATVSNTWTQRQVFPAGAFLTGAHLRNPYNIDYANHLGNAETRLHYRMLPLSSLRSHENLGNATPQWSYQGTYWRATGLGSGYIDVPIEVPTDSTILGYSMGVTNGSDQTANVYTRIVRNAIDFSAAAGHSTEQTMTENKLTALAPGAGDSGLGQTCSLLVNNQLESWCIRMQCTRADVYLRYVWLYFAVQGLRSV